MKRWLLLALLCVLSPLGLYAQTTVSGNVKDAGITNITSLNSYVRFTLAGYGSNIPRVAGTNVILTPYKDFHPDASGNISGTIQGNDTITIGGNSLPGGTWYQVCLYDKGIQFRCATYTITGGSFNLNNATPNTTTPTVPAPTGDNTYLRKDAGNSPVTGALAINNNLTVSGTGAFNGPFAAKFTGPGPWIDVSSSSYANVQAAINACPGGGATVFFPVGSVPALTSALTLISGCNYVAEQGTTLTYSSPSSANFPMLYCPNCSNITVQGFTFTGSNAGGTTNFLWTNNEGVINGQEGFFCLACQDVEVYDNTAQNLAGAGFLFVRGARERIHNNISNGNSYYGIYLLSTDNGTPTDDAIWNNTTKNNGCFGATCFQGRGIVLTTAGGVNPIIGAVNTKIGPGNVVEGNSLWGIEVYNAARGTEVFSNIVSGNGFGGIHDLRNVYANVHDNEVFGNGLANVPNGSGGTLAGITGYCISLGSSYYANVHDNNCHDNNSGGGNLGQITVSGEGNSTGAYGNKVVSNHVRNNLAASGGFDVFVSATSVSSCPNTARFYKIAAYDGSRNVLAVSAEQTNTPAASSVNLLTWKPIAGAFSYGVFESATTGTENQYYEAMAPAFLDECAAALATLAAPASGTSITGVTLTNLTTPADTYGTMVGFNNMFGSTTNTPLSASGFNTIQFDNPTTVANIASLASSPLNPIVNGQAFGTGGLAWAASLYNATFARSGGHFANGCDLCGPFVMSPVNPLLSSDTPTISAHFNTSGDSISANNGTASFEVTVGTGAAGSTGAVGLPTATTNWNCFARNLNRAAYIQQTGARSTTTATFTNYGTTIGTPVNWTNSDVLAISCFAY